MSKPSQPNPTPPPKSPGERRARARFDSMKVWDEASAALLANREVLLAVMGVFVVLPVLAIAQFVPMPQPVPGQQPELISQHWALYFNQNWLPVLGAIVVLLLGTLTTLALLGDPQRPTVSEAIRHAARAAPSFLAALFAGYMLALLSGIVPIIMFGLSGSLPVMLFGTAIGAILILYILVRFAFIGPIVLLGGERNPVTALRRSFVATKGIGWQMLVFLLLIYVAFGIVGWLVQVAFTIVATWLAGAEGGLLAGNLVGALVQGALVATFVAAIAASYRQLGSAA